MIRQTVMVFLLFLLSGAISTNMGLSAWESPEIPTPHPPSPLDMPASGIVAVPPPAGILQFSAGGHILTFKEDRVYVIGLGYALIEEFVSSSKVKPLAEQVESYGSPARENERSAKTSASIPKRVIYKNLWRGVTLYYETSPAGLAESTCVLDPGAHVDSIRFRYNVPTSIQQDGSLRFKHPTNRGYFTQDAPIAWQQIREKRVKVDVAFRDYGDGIIGFKLGTYDTHHPVIIDPTYRWHTFYGTQSGASAVAMDGGGNIYVAGGSSGTSNGIHWLGDNGKAPLHDTCSGNSRLVVMKLSSAGDYQWHTFYGYFNTSAMAIAVDENSNVYVTGATTYPILGFCYGDLFGQHPIHDYTGDSGLTNNILVLKLDKDGAFQWHTCYGYSGDVGYGIVAVNSSVYITGMSQGSWLGDKNAIPLHPFTKKNAYGNYNLVVLKLNDRGQYQWHTFYGVVSLGDAITADRGGANVYVAGSSSASWQGDVAANPKHAFTGSMDNITVLKLNAGGQYQWHTFYGSGYNGDLGAGIALDDGDANVYVAGRNALAWKGDGNANPIHAFTSGGYANITVLKLGSDGAYKWHTFYGPGYGVGVAVDSTGNAFVAAQSGGSWQGDNNASPSHPFTAGGGYNNLTVLKLNSSGAYKWHTFYGSGKGDDATGMGVTRSGSDIIIAGSSAATWQGEANLNPLHYFIVPGGNISVLHLQDFGAPTVTTTPITATAATTAAGGGNVTSDGGLAVIARGVCWSKLTNPTLADSCTTDGSGTGSFVSSLTGLTPNTPYHVRAYATNSSGTGYGSDVLFTTASAAAKSDLVLGSWSGQGVYSRNNATGVWTYITAAATQISAGDLDGDGADDLIGNWAGSGVWVKYSSTGQWAQLSSPADWIAAGDVNGDGNSDLVGIWSGVIYVRDSVAAVWTSISTGATRVAAGDLDGDGKADIIGNWPGDGIWAKLSTSGKWIQLSAAADWIATGDMNGDGRVDLLGIWGTEIWSRDSVTGTWTKLSSGASQAIAGDLDGDGKADLIGIWPGDGIWIKYSQTGNWQKIGSPPDSITVIRSK